MKQNSFKVSPSSKFDKEGEFRQYVVDFLLDGISAWVEIRDREGTLEAEKYRCNQVIRHLGSLLKLITTDMAGKLKVKIKIDILSIVNAMADELLYFSEENQELGVKSIVKHLREYRY